MCLPRKENVGNTAISGAITRDKLRLLGRPNGEILELGLSIRSLINDWVKENWQIAFFPKKNSITWHLSSCLLCSFRTFFFWTIFPSFYYFFLTNYLSTSRSIEDGQRHNLTEIAKGPEALAFRSLLQSQNIPTVPCAVRVDRSEVQIIFAKASQKFLPVLSATWVSKQKK